MTKVQKVVSPGHDFFGSLSLTLTLKEEEEEYILSCVVHLIRGVKIILKRYNVIARDSPGQLVQLAAALAPPWLACSERTSHT